MKVEKIVVNKSWGKEVWFDNNDLYCGKLLTINLDKWSSKGNFHYHVLKTETFFVIEGLLTLDIANDRGEYNRVTLHVGDSFRVEPGVKHRFTCADGLVCKFIEVSTTHRDDDSYRCYWDYKEQKWIDV